MKKINTDHAATTPVDPIVLEAMLPFFGDSYYNPSAVYPEARAVKAMMEKTRQDILTLIGGEPEGKIIFTGSGTESINLALHSAISCHSLNKAKQSGGRILVSAVEHHAVLNCAASLEQEGFTVEQLPVDSNGSVSPDTLKKYIGKDVRIVSIMTVNNETGAINDVETLCKIAHKEGARFHTDAVQALGVLHINAKKVNADYISVSAHKVYGPKGIGALYAAPSAPITPLIFGGKQEGGVRAGTENTAAIAGFGCAVEILAKQQKEDVSHLVKLKKIFLEGISPIPDLLVNSPPLGAPHIISVSVKGVEAEHCLLHLSMAGILASMGAACNAATVEPSHVVEAIGVPLEYKRGTIRFSFGRGNTAEDALRAAEELTKVIEKLR